MALPAARAFANSLVRKLLYKPPSQVFALSLSITAATKATNSKLVDNSKEIRSRAVGKKQQQKFDFLVKRRTRSVRELNEESLLKQFIEGDTVHIPVLLGEVLDVFASVPLKSFVDCTLGAGGHSAAIIQAHPEMEIYVGLDVDPVAHDSAQSLINMALHKHSSNSVTKLQVHTLMKNFKSIKTVLRDIDGRHFVPGIQGVLMDLGISSMQVNNGQRGFSILNDGPLDMRMDPQASLKAEDILNTWPDDELGRVLRDYGEESNWFALQKKIVKARLTGGLNSSKELVDLIRSSTSGARGGRQGWIKTATRVFQALRIAVNDELNTLKDSIHSCFHTLAPGGRLAVISFHSLEDRIVKQAFLDIISQSENGGSNLTAKELCNMENEAWIKQTLKGQNAVILTKRPITPSEKEEKLNPRSRSAKLRVIQKL